MLFVPLETTGWQARITLRFSLLGTPVAIRPGFWLLGIIFFLWEHNIPQALEVLVLAFVAVLAHEWGHALAYRQVGLMPRIELHALGGFTIAQQGIYSHLLPWQRIWVSVAGPLMSLLLGGLCWLVFYGAGTWPALFLPTRTAWTYVMAFTLGLGLVNLLPILPLDGGNVLRNTLSLHPRWDSELIAIVTGLVLCLLLLGLAVRDQVYWDVLIILLLARENIHLLIHRRDHRLDDQLDDINEKLQHGEPREALQDALVILEQARSQAYKRWAFRTVAFLYVYLEEYAELPALAARYPAFVERTPELEIGTALAAGQHDQALARAEETYGSHPEAWLAILHIKLILHYRGTEPAWVFLQQVRSQAFYPAVADHVSELFLRQGGEPYALELSETLFQTQGDARHAYNAACALALQGRLDEAMVWLRRALAAGFDDPEWVRTDPDLDSLRARADFPAV